MNDADHHLNSNNQREHHSSHAVNLHCPPRHAPRMRSSKQVKDSHVFGLEYFRHSNIKVPSAISCAHHATAGWCASPHCISTSVMLFCVSVPWVRAEASISMWRHTFYDRLIVHQHKAFISTDSPLAAPYRMVGGAKNVGGVCFLDWNNLASKVSSASDQRHRDNVVRR